MSQFAAHGHRVFYVSTTRFLSSDASPRVLVKRIKENVYEVQLAAARMPDVYGEVIEGDNKRSLLDALDELKIEVLGGTLGPSTLQRLKSATAELRDSSGDERLDSVLAEIEVRLAVEIAKLGPPP